MPVIGPEIPPHLLNPVSEVNSNGDSDDEEQIGPQIPAGLLNRSSQLLDSGEDDENDSIPSDRPTASSQTKKPSPPPTSKRIIGPSFPPPSRASPPPKDHDSDDDSDDDIGPKPLSSHTFSHDSDGVRDFIEREERRRKLVEDAAKPKTLKRDEWMLVPPSSSGILGSLGPTTKPKPRQFSRTSAPAKQVDNSLWTETPAERQQRIADEVSGKKRRAVNADDSLTPEEALEARKKQRKNAEIQKNVEEYTRTVRGETLIDIHAKSSSTKEDDGQQKYFGIWDHSRDMSIGGRLLDDGTRNKIIKDARGLGDRFGHGKHGGFL